MATTKNQLAIVAMPIAISLPLSAPPQPAQCRALPLPDCTAAPLPRCIQENASTAIMEARTAHSARVGFEGERRTANGARPVLRGLLLRKGLVGKGTSESLRLLGVPRRGSSTFCAALPKNRLNTRTVILTAGHFLKTETPKCPRIASSLTASESAGRGSASLLSSGCRRTQFKLRFAGAKTDQRCGHRRTARPRTGRFLLPNSGDGSGALQRTAATRWRMHWPT